METQTDTNASRKTYADNADKLCLAAIVSLLIGISSFFLCLAADRFVQPHWRSLEDVFAVGIWLSIELLCFVVPFLGLIAIINIITDWRLITNPDKDSQSEGLIRKIACRFLITSLLFAIVPLLPVILRILLRPVKNTNLTYLLGIWLIVMALLALVMGFVSYKLFTKTSVRILLRVGAIFSIFLGLIVVVSVFLSTSFGYYLIRRLEYSKISVTFSVDSNSLKQTSIVPTLNSPCIENRNIIWCSSFQLAWNRMKDDVIGAPVEVVGAEELAARLNTAEQSAEDIQADSFYAAAGRVEKGIIGKVQKDMAARFPSHSVPDFNEIADIPRAILAYSYMTANVPFKYPFRQYERQFKFTDSQGIETDVGAFGVWGLHSVYRKMREQVEVLYVREDYNEPDDDRQMKEFVIDLCRHSDPYQVVVAVVEPKDTLAQTLSYVRSQTEDFKEQQDYQRMCSLHDVDVLVVPEMLWEIEHRFKELIGKLVTNANPAMPITEAIQGIKFKLDRYGAALESETTIMVAAAPRYFRFNRPFLVYMKKRDREQPFFVMWVDNAELLNKNRPDGIIVSSGDVVRGRI